MSFHHFLKHESTSNEDYFQFTRGRFVYNERHEMSQRYVRFDIHELGRIAAEAVGSKSCIGMEKYPDGMFNKAFLLSMENGVQVVAKIPNPNAGRPHMTTASEVATMDSVRNVLKTPVPKVYVWSSNAQDNAVGAEYIIMEKLSEINEDNQRFLYTDCYGNAVVNSRFAVGPSTGRDFSDDGRITIEYDRGPCKTWQTLEEYALALGRREVTCVQSLPRLPKSPVTLFGPGTYQPTRQKKLKALQWYLKVCKYLLPTDESIQSPCLWHGDLHDENIFVNPDKPTEVVGITDWQSTELKPLFEHARLPYLMKYDGPPTRGLERPSLPHDLAELDIEDQKKANTLYLNQALSALYKTLVHKHIPQLYRALAFRETPSFNFLQLAPHLLVDGEATYLAQMMELRETWKELPGVRSLEAPQVFPFQISAQEKAEIDADAKGALLGMQTMTGIRDSLGELFPAQGVVRHDQHDEARDALRQMKEQVIQMYATNESDRDIWRNNWPFEA
ncbi:MAG: hypothetical protein Q9195_007695 [Heterodermia aff. obscurata]